MKFMLVLLIALSMFAQAQAQSDVKGSTDHPLVSRFPGTYIEEYTVSNFDEFFVVTGKGEVDRSREKNLRPPHSVYEGKTHLIAYTTQDRSLSVLQVFRNFESAFADAGLEMTFTCTNDDACGNHFLKRIYGHLNKRGKTGQLDPYNLHSGKGEYRFWSGVAKQGDQELYVQLTVGKKQFSHAVVQVVLEIGEVEALETGLVTVDAAYLSENIASSGKVVLSGIFFDLDTANITPESSNAMAIIADYIKSNSDRSFYIVGHTDSLGAFYYNLRLSNERAKAVADMLVSSYDVDQSKILPQGVGPLSPAASNETDAGRALNRRVELVAQD